MTPAAIKSLRQALGLSQPEMYYALGLKANTDAQAANTVWRWETDNPKHSKTPGKAAQALLQNLAKRVRRT